MCAHEDAIDISGTIDGADIKTQLRGSIPNGDGQINVRSSRHFTPEQKNAIAAEYLTTSDISMKWFW